MSDVKEIKVMSNLRTANEIQARDNRHTLEQVFVCNLLGSPGAGKTTLLERTLAELTARAKVGVIEGDIYTTKDADRIAHYGVPVVQINTGGGCHLDASMVAAVLPRFDLARLDMLVIENVGNLVCPADFDLGEDIKAVVLSITEGDDKPVKYPLIFRNSKAVVLNKLDLAGFTDVNVSKLEQDIRAINPEAEIFQVSCRTGDGVDRWCDWLLSNLKQTGTAPNIN